MTTLRPTAIGSFAEHRSRKDRSKCSFKKSFMSVKCYGSTSVSKTEGQGSTPCTDAKYGD